MAEVVRLCKPLNPLQSNSDFVVLKFVYAKEKCSIHDQLTRGCFSCRSAVFCYLFAA